MAKDPVCDMEVEESETATKSEYQGKIYYFCHYSCKETFEMNPQKYLEREKQRESTD